MPAGRPTDYTPEIASRICAGLSQGDSLRTVCRADDLPCLATVFNWLHKHPEFLEQYTRAKEESATAIFEEMMDIADDSTNDFMAAKDEEGAIESWRENGENIQRSKLRIDTRKWALSKILPKKFGDKIQQEHSGSMDINTMSEDQIDARLTALLNKK